MIAVPVATMETDPVWKDVDMPFEGKRMMWGGSTISQQTARNVFRWPGRDWVRKGLEAGYTVLIEPRSTSAR